MLVYAGRAPSIITFNWYLYLKLGSWLKNLDPQPRALAGPFALKLKVCLFVQPERISIRYRVLLRHDLVW